MNVLEEASNIVNGARREDYGTPLENHTATAKLWSDFLGVPISPEQVCLMNILQKISRARKRITRDTLVDIAGYAHNIELIETERKKKRRKVKRW